MRLKEEGKRICREDQKKVEFEKRKKNGKMATHEMITEKTGTG